MTKRAETWWEGVAGEAEDPDAQRDPWADRPLAAPGLTEEQQAVLHGLDDQPPVPTLDGLEDDDQPAVPRIRPGMRTGSTPGDGEADHPYLRSGWKKEEEDQ